MSIQLNLITIIHLGRLISWNNYEFGCLVLQIDTLIWLKQRIQTVG